jgi:hypothetical protein
MSQSVENTNSTLQAQRIPCEFNIPSPLYVTELHGNMHRISIRNSKTKYDEKFSPILMQDMIGKSKDRRKKNMHSRLPTHRHRRTSAPRRTTLLPAKIKQPLDNFFFFCLSLFVSGSITTVWKRLPAAAGREVDTGHYGEPGMDWRFRDLPALRCDWEGVFFFFPPQRGLSLPI